MTLDKQDCIHIKNMIESAINDNEWKQTIYKNTIRERKEYFLYGLIIGIITGVTLSILFALVVT